MEKVSALSFTHEWSKKLQEFLDSKSQMKKITNTRMKAINQDRKLILRSRFNFAMYSHGINPSHLSSA